MQPRYPGMRAYLYTLGFVAGLCSWGASEAPNLVLILADDLGYGGIGVHGCQDIPTPRIDSIARDGVRCTQMSMSWPACNAGRLAHWKIP